MSRDKDVDSVGACVGMKGMRVQSIIRELRGEKIDIIEYHEDPVTFAEKALQPAKVSRVTVVDAGEKHLEVVVDDTQLSLAIGKKGQNVRLAAKLLGWKIDIKSEEEKRQEVEQQMQALTGTPTTPLEKVPELGEQVIEKLVAAGITTVEALADMTPEQLEELPGVGPKTIEKISIAVNNYFSALEAGEGQGVAPGTEAQEGVAVDAAPDELQGESIELPNVQVENSEYQEAADTGQAFEAAEIAGVENASAADVSEVHVHGEELVPEAEEVSAPEEPQPEEASKPENFE
jgi:transcription termination/antitermination protein NusA